ncbi:acetyl-CoA acetyltransferase [Sphingomonas panacis]|uniref:Acetyl-CoA acetyltransferase n=1 Tax=Sphingomonas panacis TaxID=1560345 RepID=A0A1B3Z7A6_9SPHN|nr:beta-ketothiolase BktB [Sphingomonas panacis]AOH83314.1 acetyl-CoA acetyltransferase [Sphingomonas panacis]
MTNIYAVAVARTAIGSFGGTLKDQRPGDLGAHVGRAAIERAGIPPELVGNVVFGHVIPTHPRDHFVARIAGVGAGVPLATPALTVNRLCGSGLQAILSAAQSIMLDDCTIALAGGTEVMSRAAHYLPDLRWGKKMGDSTIIDGLNGALTDPFNEILMGVTAENVAKRYGISREQQDALALTSHHRATRAIAEGYFRDQIAPIEIATRQGKIAFDTDEYVRTGAKPGDFDSLRPVFQRDGGTVTAGNASGINDGAAAVVLANDVSVRELGLTPLGRLVAYGHAGVDPAYMGIGPVPATRNALARAGLKIDDLDIIEANEAFAAQACAVAAELGLDPDKVNPNGSGIALGHPVGATGAIITAKLLYELRRTNKRYGLTTMCIGGGQGIAAIWERA